MIATFSLLRCKLRTIVHPRDYAANSDIVACDFSDESFGHRRRSEPLSGTSQEGPTFHPVPPHEFVPSRISYVIAAIELACPASALTFSLLFQPDFWWLSLTIGVLASIAVGFAFRHKIELAPLDMSNVQKGDSIDREPVA